MTGQLPFVYCLTSPTKGYMLFTDWSAIVHLVTGNWVELAVSSLVVGIVECDRKSSEFWFHL